MAELIEYLSLIIPGSVTIIGIIVSILTFIKKVNDAIDSFKRDKNTLIEELRNSDSEYKAQINTLIEQNRELAEVNKVLVDKIAKIRGYYDRKNSKV